MTDRWLENTAPFVPQPSIPLSTVGLTVMSGVLNLGDKPTIGLCSSQAGVQLVILDPTGEEVDEQGRRRLKVLAEVVLPARLVHPLMHLVASAYTSHVKIVASNN